MARTHRLVIRLSTCERTAITALAKMERLPPSTLARRMLLQEIDRRGLWPGDCVGGQHREEKATYA